MQPEKKEIKENKEKDRKKEVACFGNFSLGVADVFGDLSEVESCSSASSVSPKYDVLPRVSSGGFQGFF